MSQTILASFQQAAGLAPNQGRMRAVFGTASALACVAIAAFIIYTTLFGGMNGPEKYSMVLTLGMVVVFLSRTGPLSHWSEAADLVLSALLAAATVGCAVYFINEYQTIASMREGIPNQNDLICYGVGLVCVLEAARRVEGMILVGVVLAAIAYMLFGEFMPGFLEHRPLWVSEVLEYSYSYQGIFGIALGSVIDVVLVFVVFGVALRITGAGDFFNFIAMRLTKGKRSGPAQCAIFASALFGSINGSAPANVAATGVLTIPMMRRAGFKPAFAGGVEASASCVGQIMPPVMGVGAFIMSEITGIAYSSIMLAAFVPALLFILSLTLAVALQAGKTGVEPVETDEDLSMSAERKAQAFTLIAGFSTLVGMLFAGFAPTYCGLAATATVLALSLLFASTRLDLKGWITFWVDSGRDGLAVMIACAAIGIVIAAFSSTGLGIKLNQMIVAMGGESLILALVLAAICSIVLGMGLPTAASYLMVVFVAGPAIMKLGVPVLQTHLFVFYYAVLSAITPPVALAIFAAAAIARTSPIALAMQALKLSMVAFVLPIVWIYHPEINLQEVNAENGLTTFLYVLALIVAVLGATASHVGFFVRHLGWVKRVLLMVAAGAVVSANAEFIIAGVVVISAILGFEKFTQPKTEGATAAPPSKGLASNE